jgi:acyl-CoA synthetase (AMP-forming)/AMP-acid ligase II
VHALGAGDLDGATVAHCTPTALRAIVDAMERGAARTLRAALVGGAHLDQTLRERAEELNLRIVSYYGAAELSFVGVDDDGTGLRPFPGVDLQVVDGELWAKSTYLAQGYLGGSAGAHRVDAGGWATVGDRAELDSAGRIHLRGRSDDAILTAGATAVPHDIEAALRSIDGVRDAVVFAIPISDTDSLVGAVVELRTDARGMSLRELRAQASTRLVASHLPRRWFWTDSLERTVSGKVARARIRADALEGKLARLE